MDDVSRINFDYNFILWVKLIMTLQLLVNQYNEDENVVTNLLDSISLQQGVDFDDFSVIMMNDGSDIILSDQFISKYNYDFSYVLSEHSGVSATRNKLLDISTGDFIMLCDADDMFINSLALKVIFDSIRTGFDVFCSELITENKIEETGAYAYRILKNDWEFVHGKVFKRDYLIENDIRWYDPLTFSGDTFFLQLAKRIPHKELYCDIPLYMWKWNPNSICRCEKNHFMKTYGMKAKCDDALIEEFLKRNMLYDVEYVVLKSFYDAYYMIHVASSCGEDISDMRFAFEKLVDKYFSIYKKASESRKREIWDIVTKASGFSSNPFMVSFDDWIKEVLPYAANRLGCGQ